MSLSPSSFLTDPLTFTLVGDTRGGPPTTHTWTRNGEKISNGGSFSVYIAMDENDASRFRESVYRSTLTVTGRLPGVYQYSVTNRAMTDSMNGNISIEGTVHT